MSDDAFIEEIQNDFLHEASDLLQKVEGLSLALSQSPESTEIYDELARLAHNFKGSGKAVGLDSLSHLGHRLEDYVLAIRKKQIPASPRNLDLLFQCLDLLKAGVEALKVDKKALLQHDEMFLSIDQRLSAGIGESKVSNVHEIQSESSPSQEGQFQSVETQNSQAPLTSQAPPAQGGKGAPASVSNKNEILRIQKQKVDFLLESFGEQVILQSTLDRCKFDLDSHRDIVLKTISQLTKLTFELQSHALSLTMVQIAPTFTKLERAARDAARTCGKNIQVVLEGGETEVDRVLIESLSDSLVHMVRNSVDHAIEDSIDRLAKAKAEQGKIWIRASRSGGQLWIEVQDDGKGLDPDRIKAKAIENGLIDSGVAQGLSNEEVYRLIFANGFSTKEVVSELSGRGVGMNVVQEAVNQLNGSIEIQSAIDKGTLFRIRLPLTLAIFNGAVVKINGESYIIPNNDIAEIGRFKRELQVKMNPSESIIRLREEIFELVDLRETLKIPQRPISTSDHDLPLIIGKKTKTAYIVDELVGIQKIVQKPLGEEVRMRAGYAAATIMSDGTPGVILNINQLRKQSA